MKKTKYFLPILGENILKDAEEFYKKHGQFSEEVLQNIHSIYGTSLEKAIDVLDSSKIIQYHTADNKRSLFVIGKGSNQFKVFESINFCFCETFEKDVLKTASILTCEHVLALKLAKITGVIKKEQMSDLHFVELLKVFSEIVYVST